MRWRVRSIITDRSARAVEGRQEHWTPKAAPYTQFVSATASTDLCARGPFERLYDFWPQQNVKKALLLILGVDAVLLVRKI